MRPNAIRAELRSLLTRAADCEASRRRAVLERDWPRAATLETELRKLWQRHSKLDLPERIA